MRVPCAERMCSTRYPCRSTPSTHVSYATSASASSTTATRSTVCCGSAATQCNSPSKCVELQPHPFPRTSCRALAAEGGSAGLTHAKPPMVCSSMLREGRLLEVAAASSPLPVSVVTCGDPLPDRPSAMERPLQCLCDSARGPIRSGLSVPTAGKLRSEIGRSVATCNSTRGGGQRGAFPSISAGLSTKPEPPLSSKSAWCSCVGRSLVCKLRAHSCAPALQ
mmetsp:Transcript_46250/g.153309  ORF Transcript_46250/g.153309 Transcript_46250/m.153309 type:complete len:222 (+) Transcript_46250:463-1128(+)